LTFELSASPRGPFSLALSARLAGDATRRFRDGVFEAAVDGGGRGELVHAWQLPDGTLCFRGRSRAGVDEVRRLLAIDDDHSEFLRRFARDPLLARAVRELRGLRPIKIGTVAQALLRALCGQLIDSRTARLLERRIVAATATPLAGTSFRLPPRRDELARFSAAELRGLGLHARRSATLLRICRELDLERLRGVPTETVVRRLGRERGLGPWSVGVICLEGLGRREHGLVGDLGLIKLCAALYGRRAEAEDTAELLSRYGEWSGIASVYLLAGFGRVLIPLPDGSHTRRGLRPPPWLRAA
jgi:3-methyladenine DNA glycosylase/8-oxoguanine DNA glycosylase